MRKDTALSFRIPSGLKEELEALAMKEGRSIAQICEAFIRGGLDSYRKEGSKYLQRFLSRRKEAPS
jgi:predicted DNA-binding protein